MVYGRAWSVGGKDPRVSFRSRGPEPSVGRTASATGARLEDGRLTVDGRGIETRPRARSTSDLR